MDFKRSFKAMALLMMGVASFTACDDDDDDLKQSSNGNVAYVLNEGSYGNNNTSISAILPRSST